MNKTKEEIQYEPFGDEWKKEINKIPKGFIIDMLSKKGKEYNALTDQIKSMEKQAVLDLDTIVNQRAIIKSMENYISDVDGQVKELREERDVWKKRWEDNNDQSDKDFTAINKLFQENTHLQSQLESLQKELESWNVENREIVDDADKTILALQSKLTASEAKLKEYEADIYGKDKQIESLKARNLMYCKVIYDGLPNECIVEGSEIKFCPHRLGEGNVCKRCAEK